MDNTTPEKAAPEKTQVKKPKGPIRFEAIVPFFIILGLFVLYFALFFDTHLRKGIEWAATRANGAEVNVGSLSTSFLTGGFQMSTIEVTDPHEPKLNRFQIGNVKFKFSWDALLRLKYVVDVAGITDIEVRTPRKSPGKVLPPPSEQESGLLAKAKAKLATTPLGDVAAVLEGLDPTTALKEVGNLKSAARIEELKSQLTQKEAEWNKNLAAIPSEKDFASLREKISAIPTTGGNPAELAARANQVKGLIQEAEGRINSVTTLGNQLTADVNGFTTSVGQIDELVKADRLDLEKKLKLPRLDTRSIAQDLFGNLFLDKLGRVEQYASMARKYIPAKKASAESLPKPERGKGRTYEFPVTNSYPSWWLKKAEISSRGEHSAFGGDVSGQLLHLSSNQALTGQPADLVVKGDFPKQQIRNVDAKITVDHRGETPMESLKAKVGAFPVAQRDLSKSESLQFGFAQALGSAGLEATLRGNQLTLASDNTFKQVQYQISSSSKILESTLRDVVKELPTITVGAKAVGSLQDLDLSISSNLATGIERGLARQLQTRLAEARKKLDAMIDAKIAGPKRELTARYTELRTRVTSQVDARRKQAEDLRGMAQAKLASLTGGGGAPQKKAVDALKKKLPF